MRSFLIAASLVLIAGPALAHTPYMRPATFYAAQEVSAETAYSTSLFAPVVGVSADGVAIIGPDGERRSPARIEVTPSVTRFQAFLPAEGTYRLTTGEHYGDVTRMVLDNGRWRAVEAGERLPRRARTSTLQMVTLAEAYVTRGAPSRGAVDLVDGRLAIRPVTHSDAITVSDGFDVDLLFDDAPFAFMPFVLYRPGQSEDDMSAVFVTDEHGRAHISFSEPGLYLAVVRFRTPAPRGANAAVMSYSTSITFEVRRDEPATAQPE